MNSEEMKKNFETNKKIRIGVLTWNLAGNLPPTNFDASKVLLPETLQQEMSLFNKPDEVDLYVVGLQEMVNLEFIGSLVCTKDEGRML
jgi:hypothetical protein